jgi:hypothetical protein
MLTILLGDILYIYMDGDALLLQYEHESYNQRGSPPMETIVGISSSS